MLVSNSGLTHDGCGDFARKTAPYRCSRAKSGIPAKKTMMPCAANVQVQPEDACQGAMKNCVEGRELVVEYRMLHMD